MATTDVEYTTVMYLLLGNPNLKAPCLLPQLGGWGGGGYEVVGVGRPATEYIVAT